MPLNARIFGQYCGKRVTVASVCEHRLKTLTFGFAVRSLSRGAVWGAIMLGSVPAFAAAATPPSPQTILISHKALYSVTLTGTRPGGDYLDVSGKMILEFTDACDAWTTSQKSLLRTVTGEGTEALSHSDFAAWESKAGDDYKFSVRQTQDGDTSEFRGRAKRNGQGDTGTAEYTKPERATYKLPPHFLFQTAQQVKLIEYARKGEHFLSGDMFDGSEGGGAAHFNAVILKLNADAAKSALKDPLLDSPPHRVRVAFYPAAGTANQSDGKAADTGEQPEYEMTMTVHDNGVVSDYDYDYQDFSVHGQLKAIQALPRPHC
ncbi:MAG: hypothetical protein JWM91_921 [Rhodospirillales bacterium]|nr:hypothetical protein [Rhodospirillales bacterium]